MIHRIVAAASTAAGAFAVCGMAYYLVCLYSAARFLGERKAAGEGARPTPAGTDPVSILKPLRGTDPEMYESFRSHCLQDYLKYEIIFGVSDPGDPALQMVEKLKLEFPQCAIRAMICGENLGSNTKVSNLAQMLRQAKHENILVNDSDIRVPSDYLAARADSAGGSAGGIGHLSLSRHRQSDSGFAAGSARHQHGFFCRRAGGASSSKAEFVLD